MKTTLYAEELINRKSPKYGAYDRQILGQSKRIKATASPNRDLAEERLNYQWCKPPVLWHKEKEVRNNHESAWHAAKNDTLFDKCGSETRHDIVNTNKAVKSQNLMKNIKQFRTAPPKISSWDANFHTSESAVSFAIMGSQQMRQSATLTVPCHTKAGHYVTLRTVET